MRPSVVKYALSLFKRIRNSQITGISSFEFSYTTGCAVNSRVEYTFKKENGSCTVTILQNGAFEEDRYKTEVPESFEAELSELLRKYRAGAWNGFDKHNRLVLDGNSFSLRAEFQNGKRLSAHGYMRWPRGYRNFRDEADELFMAFY